MNKTLGLMAGSLVLVGLMIWLLVESNSPTRSNKDSSASQKSILLYCAASNRAVVEAIRADYEEEYGVPIQIQYGPSQGLLSQLEVGNTGDLFLPADDSYLTLARAKQLVKETLPIAEMHGVVAVRKGNPKQVSSLEDLRSSEVRFIQASPDAAAIGMLTRKKLEEQNLWEELHSKTDAFRSTVTDVANDIVVDAADAGIVFDAVLATYPDLEFVQLDELADVVSKVSIGVLASSDQPTAALHFARYLSARDRGQNRYREHGFQTVESDQWVDTPELKVFAGSMLRPAIEETITQFEKREGVKVSRVYNGCGILVGQMKTGQRPDAYFACDLEFMNQVIDLFPQPIDVSQNELVILVQKGNPEKIRTLRDLTREGLRVGIGHEKQCAMGWITQNTFKEGKIQKEVMANVTVQTPTGDMLVNQLRSGSLDAAVAYLSNAAGSGDFLDAIQIQGLECAVATQPWAVAKESPYPQLASRLFESICSVESQETFAAKGFRWKKSAATSADKQASPSAL